ncbi:general stress protein [Paenibacillus oenotherae]|uniref:General stress protein n=1 Tax=Paenibacillus oenotherae TaxID=1435645 RepID=A0ABS7D9Z0_9BACL|nr:general stress protein [Paenibacillus oenotherae]MBW7476759.1 general stress protein [Paenibacillus oenotherae]
MAITTRVTSVHAVSTIHEAREQLDSYIRQGYTRDQLFVLTHEKDRTERIAEQTNAEQIGISEEGIGTSIANIFRSRGAELRAKMRSVGISESEAQRLEEEMDRDKIVVIAWGGKPYEDDEYDPDIMYYPPII